MSRPPPSWACPEYERHGDAVCPACLALFESRGSQLGDWDMFPPRVEFGPGWFSVGAVHWFSATDDVVFTARDGRRVLAQAVCGSICDVTICWAPRAGRRCRKCTAALKKIEAAMAATARH